MVIPMFSDEFFLAGALAPVRDTFSCDIKVDTGTKLGLPSIRIHDFRHSYASMLVNRGVSVSVISRLVGHSSTDVTWRIYGHLYPKTVNEAVKSLDKGHEMEQ